MDSETPAYFYTEEDFSNRKKLERKTVLFLAVWHHNHYCGSSLFFVTLFLVADPWALLLIKIGMLFNRKRSREKKEGKTGHKYQVKRKKRERYRLHQNEKKSGDWPFLIYFTFLTTAEYAVFSQCDHHRPTRVSFFFYFFSLSALQCIAIIIICVFNVQRFGHCMTLNNLH